MSYEYAGSLYDTETHMSAAQILDWLVGADMDVQGGIEYVLDNGAEGTRAEMDEDEWDYTVDDDDDFSDAWNRMLGELVFWARDQMGLKQDELGDALGYSQKNISLLESGYRTVKPVVLRALLQMLAQ